MLNTFALWMLAQAEVQPADIVDITIRRRPNCQSRYEDFHYKAGLPRGERGNIDVPFFSVLSVPLFGLQAHAVDFFPYIVWMSKWFWNGGVLSSPLPSS